MSVPGKFTFSRRLTLTAWTLAFFALGTPAASAKPVLPMRTLEFSWAAVDRAKAYELKFEPAGKGEDGAEPILINSAGSSWKGQLAAGKYRLRVRTIDRRGVPGAWGEPQAVALPLPPVEAVSPADKAVVKSEESDKAKVKLAWNDLGDGVSYRVEVRDKKGKVVFHDDLDETEVTPELPVSKAFVWTVTAQLADGSSGERWASPRSFALQGGPLEAPEITTPYEAGTPLVKWSKPKNAARYAVNLAVLDEKSGKWKSLLSNKDYRRNDLKLAEEWPEGQYRLQLAAVAPLRDTSPQTTYSFETGIRAALKGKRNSVHQTRVSYSYAPLLRTISLASATSEVGFNSFMFNSHILGAGYTYLAYPHSFGTDFSAHLSRGLIFDDPATTSSEQKPLVIRGYDFRLLGRYQYTVWRLSLGLYGGAERHDLQILYAAGLTAFNLRTRPMTDLLAGPGIDLVLGSASTIGATLLIGRTLGAKFIDSYERSVVEVKFNRRIFDDRMVSTFAFSQDFMNFAFLSPATDEPYKASWANRALSLGIGYAF